MGEEEERRCLVAGELLLGLVFLLYM